VVLAHLQRTWRLRGRGVWDPLSLTLSLRGVIQRFYENGMPIFLCTKGGVEDAKSRESLIECWVTQRRTLRSCPTSAAQLGAKCFARQSIRRLSVRASDICRHSSMLSRVLCN